MVKKKRDERSVNRRGTETITNLWPTKREEGMKEGREEGKETECREEG